MKCLLMLCLMFGMAGIASAQPGKRIVVAKDGSGDFTTVQAAFNAVPLHNHTPITIYVKDGVYKEKLHLDATKDNVTLIGQDRFNTILTYDDHTGKVVAPGDTINTRTSHSFLMAGNNFTARNITFQNNAGFYAGQAVAVEVRGDKAAFIDCRIIGNQDILFTNNPDSREYYKNCYLSGTTDFIFGSATAFFDQCRIHSKKDSHVTAASTPKDHRYGYVFYDCELTGDPSVTNASLGRPWRPYASVTYLHCYIGSDIRPAGWSNWHHTDRYKTARYSEYNDYGPGAKPAQRVKWSHQLTDQQAKQYTIKNVLAGWVPPDSKWE
ncbi:MAG TPA: pectinesterase family protein [Balneolales bacterium]|nr:pectinesterase family protein [Balneolales bacterium]